MKNILSSTKTFVILLVVTVVFLGFSTYMFARPISYGMSYHNETVYGDQTFEGTIKFYADGTMVIRNTNFDEELKSRYYYKDGYVFSTVAVTDEEYEAEVAYINDNFDEALALPFYASNITAFREVAYGVDEYAAVYTCQPAIVLAVVCGIVDLIMVGLCAASFVLCKKAKIKE